MIGAAIESGALVAIVWHPTDLDPPPPDPKPGRSSGYRCRRPPHDRSTPP